jgi:hypothetical protein
MIMAADPAKYGLTIGFNRRDARLPLDHHVD